MCSETRRFCIRNSRPRRGPWGLSTKRNARCSPSDGAQAGVEVKPKTGGGMTSRYQVSCIRCYAIGRADPCGVGEQAFLLPAGEAGAVPEVASVIPW